MANNRGVLKRQRTKGYPEGNGNAATDSIEVARVAYGLYEQRGREDGHALDDWLNAEAVVREQSRHTSRLLA